MERQTATCIVVLALATTTFLTSTASAADKPGCRPPAWATARLPGYEIADCTDRVWQALTVDTREGTRGIEGRTTTVEFHLSDDPKNASNGAARGFFAAAGQRAGGQLVSDPNEGWSAVLTARTQQGEAWWIYTHGSGNEAETGSFTLTTLQIVPFPQEVQVRADAPRLDITGTDCRPPPWLSRQFPYYRFDGCRISDYDRVTLDLPGGAQTIAGLVVHADYRLTDDAKDQTAAYIWRNYADALRGSGAKLVSDPERRMDAALTRETANGPVWMLYQHGDGNDDSTRSYRLTTIEPGPMPQEIQARATDTALETHTNTCADPPWLTRQFPYFERGTCAHEDFGTLELDLPDGKKTLAGHILRTSYGVSDSRRDPARFFVRDNFVNALRLIGATLVSDPEDLKLVVMTRPIPQGEMTYIYQQTAGTDQAAHGYELVTVQQGGPAPKSCVLEVYGINFDFDRATLRPDSEPVLNQVKALFAADSAYAAEIGGHTDNVGTRAYNTKLSADRAAAVKAWLAGQGVAAGRMTTAGYADTKPLVPNTTDENRFRNRRVELRRVNCKE